MLPEPIEFGHGSLLAPSNVVLCGGPLQAIDTAQRRRPVRSSYRLERHRALSQTSEFFCWSWLSEASFADGSSLVKVNVAHAAFAEGFCRQLDGVRSQAGINGAAVEVSGELYLQAGFS